MSEIKIVDNEVFTLDKPENYKRAFAVEKIAKEFYS